MARRGGTIGLAAYRALSGRGRPPQLSPVSDRPPGELVWINAAEDGNERAAHDLARELVSFRDGLQVLFTTQGEIEGDPASGLIFDKTPVDHPGTTAAFIRHWSPDVSLWIWGGLRPNLVLSSAALGNPTYFVDISQDGFEQLRSNWLPEMTRQLLTHFHGWYARSEAARSRLIDYGLPADEIERTAPLRPMGYTLPAAETDLDDLRGALSSRPAWFARNVGQDELSLVIEAHQMAMRITPRLILMVEPASEHLADGMASYIDSQALRFMRWSEGDMPTENTQILLADLPDEAGLWHRVASVSFLGQTVAPTGMPCDPFEAAAHGSAILFGTKPQIFQAYYDRLAEVGGARIVRDAQSLATAVIQLLAPDDAARVAIAAWDTVTEGAGAANRIIEVVTATLDDRAEGRA